jgi:hypothetical protein
VADDETLGRDYAAVMAASAGAHVSEETCEAFALGELAPAERETVGAHIVGCAECSAVYRSLRQLEQGARAFDPHIPAAQQALQASSLRPWYAIAASLLIVVVGYAGYRTLVTVPATPTDPSPSAVAVVQLARIEVGPAEVRLSAERALATRGSTGSRQFLEDFGRAIEPYRRGRYADAAQALALTAAKYPDAYEPAFYHGVSALLAGDGRAAVDVLARAAALAPPSLQDEIRWYRAAALQRTDEIDQARELLQTLCNGGSIWRDRACALVHPTLR